MWRAIRYGLDGRHDRPRARRASTRRARRSSGCSTGPSRCAAELGVEPVFPERNGAQRQRAMIEAGREPRGGVRGVGRGDREDIRRGGARMSDPAIPGSRRAERRGAARGLRGRTAPHHGDRHDRPGDRLAAQHRRAETGPAADASRAGTERAGERAAASERDLEQVRDAIDAAMALLAILERRIPAEQLRAAARRALAAADGLRGRGPRGGEPAEGGEGPEAVRRAGDEPGWAEGRRRRPRGRQAAARPAASRASGARAGRVAAGRLLGARALGARAGARFRQSGLRASGRPQPTAPHDRLRPRLRRMDARAESDRLTYVRATVLARHFNQTAEDFS